LSRVLLFGGDGMLGRHLYQALNESHDLCVTLHGSAARYPERLFAIRLDLKLLLVIHHESLMS
jgi:nucleoside-diphosphate-sugar epimerase